MTDITKNDEGTFPVQRSTEYQADACSQTDLTQQSPVAKDSDMPSDNSEALEDTHPDSREWVQMLGRVMAAIFLITICLTMMLCSMSYDSNDNKAGDGGSDDVALESTDASSSTALNDSQAEPIEESFSLITIPGTTTQVAVPDDWSYEIFDQIDEMRPAGLALFPPYAENEAYILLRSRPLDMSEYLTGSSEDQVMESFQIDIVDEEVVLDWAKSNMDTVERESANLIEINGVKYWRAQVDGTSSEISEKDTCYYCLVDLSFYEYALVYIGSSEQANETLADDLEAIVRSANYGTASSDSPTNASANSDSSSMAILEEPIYRMVGSRLRDSDVESRYDYDEHNLIASFQYGGASTFTYKNDGMTREERPDGQSTGFTGTYTENASCDELGRIVRVEREAMGNTVWVDSYTYYGDTFNLETHTEESSGTSRIVSYNEDGFVTSIEVINTNKGESATATFAYEKIDEAALGFEYTDFDGTASQYVMLLDDSGNIVSISDGTLYVDFIYEAIEQPSAWVFTETNEGEAMLGYTTRQLFDTLRY